MASLLTSVLQSPAVPAGSVVLSKLTGQRFEVIESRHVTCPAGILYSLRPLEPILRRVYADRYKELGSVGLMGVEIEPEQVASVVGAESESAGVIGAASPVILSGDNELCGGCGAHFETEPHAKGCHNAASADQEGN